jgi:hypothetical protein
VVVGEQKKCRCPFYCCESIQSVSQVDPLHTGELVWIREVLLQVLQVDVAVYLHVCRKVQRVGKRCDLAQDLVGPDLLGTKHDHSSFREQLSLLSPSVV